MIVVEIYSRPDCSLCDRAKAKLREIQRQHPFALREILLHEGDERYAEFAGRVPVIIVDGDVTYEYTIPEAEFIRDVEARSVRQ